MQTILWDNDGVLVDTEGLYFRATQEVLRTIGVPLTSDQFKEISLRRGESTFVLAVERGISDDEIARLRAERDRRYAELLGSQSWAIDGAEEVLRSLHGQVRMGVVPLSEQRQRAETDRQPVPLVADGQVLQRVSRHRHQQARHE
jgi:beta-phosphoglucomutase-like phosphatase (HAD superfamily)